MFTKLKQKVTEQSKSDITSTLTTETIGLFTPENILKSTNEESLSSIKSTSEDNQSSDDALSFNNSQNSKKIDERECIENFNDETNFNVTNIQEKINDFFDNDEKSIKYQFHQLNQSLLSQIEELTNELNEKTTENEEIRSELIKLNNKLEENELELENQKTTVINQEIEIRFLKNDKNELLIKLADLTKNKECLANLYPNSYTEPNEAANLNESLSNSLKIKPISNDSEEISARINQVTSLKESDEIKMLQDQISEKNKIIKNLQQRLNDMKKTLQKEFKQQSSTSEPKINDQHQKHSNDLSDIVLNKPNSQNNYSNKITNTVKNQKQNNHVNKLASNDTNTAQCSNIQAFTKSSTHLSNLHDDVNFKYLKHVVLKFLTSKEYEAFHLIKALSVLLNFTNDEEQILKDTLKWKMSWFGSRPNVKV